VVQRAQETGMQQLLITDPVHFFRTPLFQESLLQLSESLRAQRKRVYVALDDAQLHQLVHFQNNIGYVRKTGNVRADVGHWIDALSFASSQPNAPPRWFKLDTAYHPWLHVPPGAHLTMLSPALTAMYLPLAAEVPSSVALTILPGSEVRVGYVITVITLLACAVLWFVPWRTTRARITALICAARQKLLRFS
jgi:hypothetical protein